MNDHSKLHTTRDWLRLFKKKSRFSSTLSTLKFLATGSFTYWIKIKILNLLAHIYDANPFTKHNLDNKLIKLELNYLYGRKLTDPQKEKIDDLISKDLPPKEIRALILNKVINKQGKLKFSLLRETYFYISGLVFIIICLGTYTSYSLAFILSTGPLLIKIIALIVMLLITIFSIYITYYFSLLPFMLLRKYRNSNSNISN